jgi:hypothetical protein
MCYAVTIGHVSALVQSFDTPRRLYNERIKRKNIENKRQLSAFKSIKKLKNIWHGENYLEKCVIEYQIIMNIVFKEKFLIKIQF